MEYEVVIVGGGLAGLTSALHLRQKGCSVLLIEKNTYPNHKVCGEYISREVLPYLTSLGIDLADAVSIQRLEISDTTGKAMRTRLPLGGIGISRYSLDNRLYKKALEAGVEFIFDEVSTIDYCNDHFLIKTSNNKTVTGAAAIGAFGKRSQLDKSLKRPFTKHKAPWLAVKAHYHYPEFPSDLVGVHSFNGGYGGVSKTESGAVNFCYLANYKSFKPYGDIQRFNNKVVSKNPLLMELLENAVPLFEKPLTIAQVSFERKQQVMNHVLMCGDAAGLIHPLCGNGMAMAIHSAKIASELVFQFLKDPAFSRDSLERTYSDQWNRLFGQRLWWGRKFQGIILNRYLSTSLIRILGRSENLTQNLIRKTHGNLIPSA